MDLCLVIAGYEIRLWMLLFTLITFVFHKDKPHWPYHLQNLHL